MASSQYNLVAVRLLKKWHRKPWHWLQVAKIGACYRHLRWDADHLHPFIELQIECSSQY